MVMCRFFLSFLAKRKAGPVILESSTENSSIAADKDEKPRRNSKVGTTIHPLVAPNINEKLYCMC